MVWIRSQTMLCKELHTGPVTGEQHLSKKSTRTPEVLQSTFLMNQLSTALSLFQCVVIPYCICHRVLSTSHTDGM